MCVCEESGASGICEEPVRARGRAASGDCILRPGLVSRLQSGCRQTKAVNKTMREEERERHVRCTAAASDCERERETGSRTGEKDRDMVCVYVEEQGMFVCQ